MPQAACPRGYSCPLCIPWCPVWEAPCRVGACRGRAVTAASSLVASRGQDDSEWGHLAGVRSRILSVLRYSTIHLLCSLGKGQSQCPQTLSWSIGERTRNNTESKKAGTGARVFFLGIVSSVSQLTLSSRNTHNCSWHRSPGGKAPASRMTHVDERPTPRPGLCSWGSSLGLTPSWVSLPPSRLTALFWEWRWPVPSASSETRSCPGLPGCIPSSARGSSTPARGLFYFNPKLKASLTQKAGGRGPHRPAPTAPHPQIRSVPSPPGHNAWQ